MNDSNTAEVLAWATFGVLLVTFATVLAYYVTPWALLMLLFLPSYSSGEAVTVERHGTTVKVEKKEVDTDDIERAVQRAVAPSRQQDGDEHPDEVIDVDTE